MTSHPTTPYTSSPTETAPLDEQMRVGSDAAEALAVTPQADGITAGEAEALDRQPKGDHNRRLSLGLDADAFAAEAGVTVKELRDYEQTAPDHDFDLDVAHRIGAALERLERNPPASQKVSNGPTP